MFRKKPAKPTKEQEKIQKIMQVLMLPVGTVSYETLIKEETEKREKILPKEIARLEKEIRQLPKKDLSAARTADTQKTQLDIQQDNALTALNKSKAEVKRLEDENINEFGLLKKELSAATKNNLDMELINKPRKEAEAKQRKEAAAEAKQRKEAEAEAKRQGQAFIKEKLKIPKPKIPKAKIPMSILKQIHDRKTFFEDINDEAFKILQEKVNKIFEKHKNEPLANIVELEESEKESEKESEEKNEKENKKESEEKNEKENKKESEYTDVSLLLQQQEKLLTDKVKEAEEKNKAAKDGALKREDSPALKKAREEQDKAQKAHKIATDNLEAVKSKLRALPAVKLQKDLKTKKDVLDPYVQYKKALQNKTSAKKVNPIEEEAIRREKKITQKNILHQAIKANIAKQLRSRAVKEFDEAVKELDKQEQIIAKIPDPKTQDTLLKELAEKRKKLNSDAGLDRAVEYCIGQLEQISPEEQKKLQKNCYTAGWHNARDDNKQKTDTLVYRTPQNVPLQMSEIHQLVYSAYVDEALKIDGIFKAIPKVLPELAARQHELTFSQESVQPPKPAAEKSTNLPAIDTPTRKRAATAPLTMHTQQQAPTTQPTTRPRAITWLQI